MADDLDIEAMLEAPYKKVRVCLSFAHETVSRTLLLNPLLLTCRMSAMLKLQTCRQWTTKCASYFATTCCDPDVLWRS
uniref:Uncharacterized protein n=1 Tax=Pundamilia nyererei TaxID=303518 RepID=A0A3B4FXW7_9CICH